MSRAAPNPFTHRVSSAKRRRRLISQVQASAAWHHEQHRPPADPDYFAQLAARHDLPLAFVLQIAALARAHSDKV
jgi:hypothetical protein